MGCTQSKVEHEETVTRCKDRKRFMKDAVSSRNAFTAAHSLYAMSLKNTGAALTDYAHGEVLFHHSHPPSLSSAAAGALPPAAAAAYDTSLPPPPPPLPNFTSNFPSNFPPIQRAATLPADISLHKRDPSPADPISEEEEEEEDEIEAETGHGLKHRTSRSSGGGGGGGGGGSRTREVEDEVLPPPPSPPRTPPVTDRDRAAPPPPPPPESKDTSTWDFFFLSMENMPGPTLADVDEDRIEREELERKMNEERSKADEVVDGGGDGGGGRQSHKAEATEVTEKVAEPPPEPPPATKVVKKMKHVTSLDGKQGGKGGPNANLLWIFSELDNCFLEASESAHDVSMMLEANRLHYHSNFADNRGHIDHSARVMRAITWNRSFRGLLNNADDEMDDLDSEKHETHATVLDKMLAWEKKLYDEVKAGEEMKLEYQRKVASLNKLKKRGARTESIEKAKATVSHLHTRYIVDMQSMDSTVSEINRLRDEQLYPKLVDLVDGMATMWATMRKCHDNQSQIVTALRFLDISQSPKETTDHHHERTDQLWKIVNMWHTQFQELITHQNGYIRALNSWLKLNLIPIDNNLKEKVSSPRQPQNPPMQTLLQAWNAYLERLPSDRARTAMSNFAAIMHAIVECQAEELKLRNRCEESRKELARKARQFDDWHNKYRQRRTPAGDEEMDLDSRPQGGNLVAEKQFTVEMAKKKLEDDEEAYQRQCIHVRDKSLASLKAGLPEIFRALFDCSDACSAMYSELRSISQPHQPNQS